MSQFYVPGPAQVWVGTGGTLPTRIAFPGGGPNCTGANAVVSGVDATTGAITNFYFADHGKKFVNQPRALAIGGGWGYSGLANISGGSVTNIARIGDWAYSSYTNGGTGFGYRASSDFAFEFAGWTEGPVLVDISSPPIPFLADYAGDGAAHQGVQSRTARVTLSLKRYNQAVLDRMVSRCSGGLGADSCVGSASVGSLVIPQFLYFPLVIRAPYASAKPKRFFYGSTDKDGNARDGMMPGIHFPVATIESRSTPFSWRARAETLNITCHWAADEFSQAGMLYDYAADCIGGALGAGGIPSPD